MCHVHLFSLWHVKDVSSSLLSLHKFWCYSQKTEEWATLPKLKKSILMSSEFCISRRCATHTEQDAHRAKNKSVPWNQEYGHSGQKQTHRGIKSALARWKKPNSYTKIWRTSHMSTVETAVAAYKSLTVPQLFVPSKGWEKMWWKHFTPTSAHSSRWRKQCSSFHHGNIHLQLPRYSKLLGSSILLQKEGYFSPFQITYLKTTTSVSAVAEWWPVYTGKIGSYFARITCLNNAIHALHCRSGTDDGEKGVQCSVQRVM